MSIKGTSKYDKETIVNLYTVQNLTCPQIAEKYKISLSTVYYYLQKSGINYKTRKQGK